MSEGECLQFCVIYVCGFLEDFLASFGGRMNHVTGATDTLSYYIVV